MPLDPLSFLAAKFGTQALGAVAREGMNYASGVAGGKAGEQTGGYNERESRSFRDANDQRNMDATNRQNGANQDATNVAGGQGQNLSRGDTAFANQLQQSNKRADTALNMSVYDQDNAFQNGRQLAQNYTDTANRQAATSANLMASILGGQMGGARR